MPRSASWLLKALVVLVLVACEWNVHAVLRSPVPEAEGGAAKALLMVVPLLAVAALAAVRIAHRLVAAAVVAGMLPVAWLLMQYGTRGGSLGLAFFYGLPHAVIYLMLAWMFGRTLFGGREALITRLARQVHGSLPPVMESYTRRITLAWCVFFCAQVAVSLGLALFASMEAWSLFVNRMNLPLITAMFAGEYVYRIARHRDFPHASIATSISAFVKHSRSAAGTQ